MFPGEFHLRFPLSRRERWLLTRRGYRWRFYYAPVLVLGLALLVVKVHWAFGLPLVAAIFIYRGLFIDLLELVFKRIRVEDVIIHEMALGFLSRGERWWVFQDGILDITQHVQGIWTIRHYNGTVIHIPAKMITDAHIAHIDEMSKQGPYAATERGRKVFRARLGLATD